MKPKKKNRFNLKSFFVAHIEKILLAFLIPVALYIAYLGTKYEPLTWKPEDLQQISEQANTHVRNNEWTADDEEVKIIPYDVQATWIKVGVKADLYKSTIQWMPSLFPEKNKRPSLESQQLLAVQDLKAYTGLGAVAINPASAAARVAEITTPKIGRRWSVITGLIPVKEQLEYYVNAFSTSVHPDPMRDMPLYVFYEVERAEIEPGQTADQLQWKKLDFYRSLQQNLMLWATPALDPVDPNYIAPSPFSMAYPLPPIDKKFGEEVAHPPAIPLLTDTQMKQAKQMEKLQEKMLKEMVDFDERDFLDQDPFSASGAFGNMRPGMGANMSGGGSMDSGMSGEGNTTRRRRSRRPEKEKEEEIFKPVEVTNYLFRFFDFEVEPGKTYRYRVRLFLANPNYRLPANVLLEEASAEQPRLETAYSVASNMVTIPLESRVLNTGVTAASARTPWVDPLASIMAVHFDITDGSEWCVERDRVYRGSTVNFPRQTGENYALSNKPAMSGFEGGMDTMGPPPEPGGGGRRPPRGGRPPKNPPKPKPEDDESKRVIDIVSDVCILDMDGGVMLPKQGGPDIPDTRSPGRLLVLEPSGSLVIRNNSTDFLEVEAIKTPMPALGGMGSYGEGMSGPSGMGMPY